MEKAEDHETITERVGVDKTNPLQWAYPGIPLALKWCREVSERGWVWIVARSGDR